MHRAGVGRTSSLIDQTGPLGTSTVVAPVREVIHTVSLMMTMPQDDEHTAPQPFTVTRRQPEDRADWSESVIL